MVKGDYQEVDQDMCEAIKDITRRGNDAEIRQHMDGSYDVFEVEKRKKRLKHKKAS